MSDTSFNTTEEKASYGLGMQMGQQLRSVFRGVSLDAAIAGVKDAYAGSVPQVDAAEINDAFRILQEKINEEEAANASKYAAEGEAFLAENAERPDVVVTESGLQYEIIQEGSGEKPTLASTVRTHYSGTLINGVEFDSSYKRDEPAEFPVQGVIAGWTEALQMMSVGSKWRLFVPYQLAYGAQGAGGAIGPYQALVFEVELLEIV
ncbi:MAG: FKBP-type peptidyl-prolyl cis-trans isomerase [Porticoccaceae bacterium]